jgi:hypothetical protein
VYEFYGTVRVLIGGLSAHPPAEPAKTINSSGPRGLSGHIGTSIPGVRNVNLDPLFYRARRLSWSARAATSSPESTPCRRARRAGRARSDPDGLVRHPYTDCKQRTAPPGGSEHAGGTAELVQP